MCDCAIPSEDEVGGMDDLTTDFVENPRLRCKLKIVQPIADGKGKPQRVDQFARIRIVIHRCSNQCDAPRFQRR